MAQVNIRLEADPEILERLEKDRPWSAAHADGSDNRINGNAVAEAASYHLIFGALAAGAMWFRKKFRNRGKTKADLAAEKEAAGINRTCTALQEMLSEYLRAAREGTVDMELLDELAGTLEEMHGFAAAGMLAVPGIRELSEIRNRIADFTAAIAENRSINLAPAAESPGTDEFALIREQLLRQKELLG